MDDMKAFVRKHRIRCEAEMVGENPNAPDWHDAYHYKVVLRRGRKKLTTYFSMGYAHSRGPTAEDVLDCLASDSAGVDQPFESWAGDYGYDTDSRRAERTYKVCVRQAANLRRLLGEDLTEELLYQTERL